MYLLRALAMYTEATGGQAVPFEHESIYERMVEDLSDVRLRLADVSSP